MTRSELSKFIQQNIAEQGNASAMALSSLVEELIKRIPCVVHIANTSTKSGGKTIYKIIDTQEEINAIIESIKNNDLPSICVHDNGVSLHFSHIEISDNLVTCYLTTFDGNYVLSLSEEEGFSELTHAKNNTLQ